MLRQFIRVRLLSLRLNRRTARLERRLRRMERSLQLRQQELASHERQFKAAAKDLSTAIAGAREQLAEITDGLDEITSTQRKFETEIDAERQRRKVLEESTIPALVAANKLALERYDADTAVQVRRQVAAGVQEERL